MSCGAGSRVPDVASSHELSIVVAVRMQDESSVLGGQTHFERRFEHFGFYQATDVLSGISTLKLIEPCYTMLNG